MDFFLAHGLQPLSSYVPDIAVLRKGSGRVVVGIGATSKGQVAHRTALSLVEPLGIFATTFPGGRAGDGENPVAFADKLQQVLHRE